MLLFSSCLPCGQLYMLLPSPFAFWNSPPWKLSCTSLLLNGFSCTCDILMCISPFIIFGLYSHCASDGYRLCDYERFVSFGPLFCARWIWIWISLATTPTEEQLYNVGQSSSVLSFLSIEPLRSFGHAIFDLSFFFWQSCYFWLLPPSHLLRLPLLPCPAFLGEWVARLSNYNSSMVYLYLKHTETLAMRLS